MSGLGVNLASYQNGKQDGDAYFGVSSQGDMDTLQDLSKALEARAVTGRETTDSLTASGASLKVESLEKTLKVLTFGDSEIKLFRSMPNSPAYNTVEEFVQIVDYGRDRGGFYSEGETPNEEDSVYRRRAELVKYMGVTKSVTHPMQLVNTIAAYGNAVQTEIQNGTLWILRKVDKALTTADSKIVPEEFNGLYAQHRNNDDFSSYADYMNSELVVDLRGSWLKQDDVETGSQVILNNFGQPSRLCAPPVVMSNFAKDYYTKQRIILDGSRPELNVGAVPKVISTTAGDISILNDIFMTNSIKKLLSSAATSSQAPSSPTAGTGVSGGASGAVTDTGTKFGLKSFQAANGAGDYKYAVSALNKYGESALTALGAGAVTVSATQSVDLSFSSGGGSFAPTGYTVYRTKVNDTTSTPTYYPLFSISASDLSTGYDGGSAGIVRDRNRFLPSTQQSFITEFNSNVLMWKQLAPLMKMDLARLGPAYRFMVLLYGTPQMYAPRKFVRYINIGDYVAS